MAFDLRKLAPLLVGLALVVLVGVSMGLSIGTSSAQTPARIIAGSGVSLLVAYFVAMWYTNGHLWMV